jgi:hypothetical protein
MNPIIYYLFLKISCDPYTIQWTYHIKKKDEITKKILNMYFENYKKRILKEDLKFYKIVWNISIPTWNFQNKIIIQYWKVELAMVLQISNWGNQNHLL